MWQPPKDTAPTADNLHLLLAYLADLELEVDRLRKQGDFVQHEVRTTLRWIHPLCAAAPLLPGYTVLVSCSSD